MGGAGVVLVWVVPQATNVSRAQSRLVKSRCDRSDDARFAYAGMSRIDGRPIHSQKTSAAGLPAFGMSNAMLNRPSRPCTTFARRSWAGDFLGPKRMKLLRSKEVTKATGLSRMTIYRLEKCGDFPGRVRLSRNSVAWRSEDIDEWIASRPLVAPAIPKDKPQATI